MSGKCSRDTQLKVGFMVEEAEVNSGETEERVDVKEENPVEERDVGVRHLE